VLQALGAGIDAYKVQNEAAMPFLSALHILDQAIAFGRESIAVVTDGALQ